jgi:hypothetical protein
VRRLSLGTTQRAMAAPARFDLLMFVAGEPETGGSLRSAGTSFLGRLGGGFAPSTMYLGLHEKAPPATTGSSTSETDPRAWHLSPGQTDCVNMVLDIAEREKRRVTVIDVDRPIGQVELVRRWVGPEDVLPLLVRPDGSRLMGLESFTPRNVRRFIRRP